MYVKGLFILSLFLIQTSRVQPAFSEHGSTCLGPYSYPTFENVRYKQTATEDGTLVLAEVEMTSLYQVTLTWIIREYYDSWPNTALYYFVPDEGDGNFDVRAQLENNSTKFRIKGGPIEDAKKKIYARISIEYPCNTIVLTMNVHTLQLVTDGTIDLPVFLELPKPLYIVGPGDPLTLTFRIEMQRSDSTAHYGFSRHLHRVGDNLVVQQRFNNITRYNLGSRNVNYTKYIQNSGSFSNLTVLVKFRPFLRTDAGVFSVSQQTSYWLPGGPYRHHTMVLLQTFVDIRSRRNIPPGFVVYNELAWIFNETQKIAHGGRNMYIIPLPKKALWRPSLMCFAHSQRAPRLRVYRKKGRKRIPLKSSQVYGLKTVTGEAFSVKTGVKSNFTCNSFGDNRANVDFRILWYDPVKITRRMPDERMLSVKRRRSIRIRCAGSGSPRPFAKFYLFDSLFGYIPHRKDFTTLYKDNEIQRTNSFTVSSSYNRKRKQVTGKLTVRDSDSIKRHKILLCLIGNEYSFDFYRYHIVEY